MRKIKVIKGKDPDRGREFALPAQGPLVIGRALDTATKFVDTLVSGKHCQIEVRGDAVYLTDRNSSNGTFLGTNDENLARLEPNKPVPLLDGQRIRLGNDTVLEYIDESVHQMETVRASDQMIAQLRAAQAGQQAPPTPPAPEPRSRPAPPPAPPPAPAPAPAPQRGSSTNMPVPPGLNPASNPILPPLGESSLEASRLPANTIGVACKYCGQQLVAQAKYAGMQVRCPTCKNMNTLPGTRPATGLNTNSSASLPALPPMPQPAPPAAQYPAPPAQYPAPVPQPMQPPAQPPMHSLLPGSMSGALPSAIPMGGPMPGEMQGSMPSFPSFPPVPASSSNMPAYNEGGAGMLPTTLPPMSYPPPMPRGLPGAAQMPHPSVPHMPQMPQPGMPPGLPPMGTMFPNGMQAPSMDVFQMPPVEPTRPGLKPLHMVLLSLPVVAIVATIIVVIVLMLTRH